MFRLSMFALAIAGLSFIPTQDPSFDPVGTWHVTTMSEMGAPMAVTITVAGKPGAYTGRAVTPDSTLPLLDLATTPSSMIALFNFAPKGVVVMRVTRSASGGYGGAWAGIEQVYPLTAKRQ